MGLLIEGTLKKISELQKKIIQEKNQVMVRQYENQIKDLRKFFEMCV